MIENHRSHPFPHSHEDRESVQTTPQTAQTLSPSYKLAFDDFDFLCRDELRPVRLQLELMKPELLMQEYGVQSTVVLFGGSRIPAPETKSTARPVLAELSRYYDMAREFARLITRDSKKNAHREKVIVTGGGPGIMEAGNRGAADAGGVSMGLNIVLPHEQAPNNYVTPDLCFNFHYFAVRKMHFLMRADAAAFFPGGFGTMDELFECLTLIQTGRMKRIPVLLFGRAFWDNAVNWQALADAGTIAEEDLQLFRYVESAEEGVAAIRDWEAELKS